VIVLVTGGAGFIGLNLLRLLLRVPDCEIRVLDDFSNSSPERITQVVSASQGGAGRVRVIRADITNASSLNGVTDGVDAIVHLAAQTGVILSLANARRDMEQNIIGTFNMLEACRTAKIRRFVHASSAAVLGNVRPPQHEDMPSRPLVPYAASKAAGESYCKAYHHSFGIETIALRFSNVYGPLSWNKGSVVAKFLKGVLAGEPLVVNGDGTQTRDFIYVEDLARILVQAVQSSLDPALLGGACNIATGVQTQVIDLAHAVCAAFAARERQCRVEFGPPLIGDTLVSAPTTDRRKHLFPDATFCSIAEGLPTTIDWFLAHWPSRAKTGLPTNVAE